MSRILGIALLIAGIVLLIYGLDASQSFGSSVSKFFNGAPTNKSIALLVIGGIVSAAGFLSLMGKGAK